MGERVGGGDGGRSLKVGGVGDAASDRGPDVINGSGKFIGGDPVENESRMGTALLGDSLL